ncbi:hypothetical protein XU18_2181 [Perkinsela sp. CCAP 1560/4]|nr:hypothetical protein XU18_2181 [Perkinsela sp. CCAP 1560/4]|eukprot:KNH07136.1 hypothetical protein XU18_2181 [Perkinsela sp. CCAP 1560/4]
MEVSDLIKRGGLSPIAVDIVRLLDCFRKLLESGDCEKHSAFQQAFDRFSFQNIHLATYKPFTLDRNHKNTVHYSERCTDECEFHNDLLRVLYAHITAYFTLTTWRKNPLVWAFAIELLVAIHYTIPLPHAVPTESSTTFSHAKYQIPLSPHVIRQIRLFAEYVLWQGCSSANCLPSTGECVLPILTDDERHFVADSIRGLYEGNLFRVTPSMEMWYADELRLAHEALDVPIKTPTRG